MDTDGHWCLWQWFTGRDIHLKQQFINRWWIFFQKLWTTLPAAIGVLKLLVRNPRNPLNEGQTIWRLAEVPFRISEIAFLDSLSFQILIINFALQNKIESGPESLGSWSLPSISILEYPFKQFQVGRQRNGRMMSQQSAMFLKTKCLFVVSWKSQSFEHAISAAKNTRLLPSHLREVSHVTSNFRFDSELGLYHYY